MTNKKSVFDGMDLYEGCCATCKHFYAAHSQWDTATVAEEWLDDEGWCNRYPPIPCKGRESGECNTRKYSHPGVVGSDHCGEYERSPLIPKNTTKQMTGEEWEIHSKNIRGLVLMARNSGLYVDENFLFPF